MSDKERKIIGHGMLGMIILIVLAGGLNVVGLLNDTNAYAVLMLLCGLYIPLLGLIASIFGR